MYHKYNLYIGGGNYDITGCISNWDDIVSKIKRNNYDGLERTFTYKFEFTGKAYSLLKNEFDSNKLKSSAAIEFSLRNNSWTYNSQFRCSLDFSSYEDDGYIIEINSLDDTMKSKIKANGGTEYEFEVQDLKIDFDKLYYSGLEIKQSCEWTIAGDSMEGSDKVSVEINGYTRPPVYLAEKELLYQNLISIHDQEYVLNFGANVPTENYIIRSKRDSTFYLKIKFDVYNKNDGQVTITLVLNTIRGSFPIKNVVVNGLSGSGTVLIDENISLKSGESLSISMYSLSSIAFEFSNIDISALWSDRGLGGDEIDVIDPGSLLSKLVKRMTGNEDASGYIDESYDDRLKYTYLCAAESLRGIQPTEERSGAKVYTSFNKFRDWMKSTFGYVYETSGNNVIFRHRRAYFENTVVKQIEKLNGYKFSVNKGIIYSRVKAGYDKKEYDTVNARDEFHFSSVYSTGITLTDTELNLVSPYRCDTYGIEILISKRKESTTDSGSDKDLFFLGLEWYRLGEWFGAFRLRRNIPITGIISPNTQFNAMFSPRACIIANKELIGACTDELVFASSEGNSDVTIGGISEKETITISPDEKIFTAGTISVNTPEIKLPTNLRGLVKFEYHGKDVIGYISEVDTSQGKNKESTFKLLEKA